MLKFSIKRKSKKQMIMRAEARQRAKDEKFWTAELEKQRNTFLSSIQEKESNIRRECNQKIKKAKEYYEKENLKLKNRVVEANQKLRDNQEAWLVYKEWIPKALDHATAIRTGLFLKQQEITRIMKTVHGGEDGLEALQRMLIDKTEKIEKLLHFENK